MVWCFRRIIHFDIKSSLLIIGTANPSPATAAAPDHSSDHSSDHIAAAGPSRSTLLVNASIPLLGKSPSAKDVSEAYGSGWGSREAPQAASVSVPVSECVGSAGLINRERLRIERGEWICVVGWLEGEVSRRIELVSHHRLCARLCVQVETMRGKLIDLLSVAGERVRITHGDRPRGYTYRALSASDRWRGLPQ